MKLRCPSAGTSLAAIALLCVATGCAGHGIPRSATRASMPGNEVHRFAVQGMMCDSCARGIRSELEHTPGVVRAFVSQPAAAAVVEIDPHLVAVPKLVEVIREAGFQAREVPLREH